MNRLLLPAMIVIAAIFVSSLIVLFILANRAGPGATGGGATDPLKPDRITEGLVVPAFSLTDQEGRPATEQILDGRVTVVDFIFTNCPFVCPQMTGAMADLAARLKDTPVRFVSVSVDPEHDTPDALREYGRKFNADPARWTFLTGDQETVKRIIHDSLMFELRPDPSRTIETAGGGMMNNITHPSKLVLIGPDRSVLGMYEFAWEEEMNALAERARAAAAALSRRR